MIHAYLQFKRRWWMFLWVGLGTLFLFVMLPHLTALLGPILGIANIVLAYYCYSTQFMLVHKMSERTTVPRISNRERGFWYTLMLLGLVGLVPGMILESGVFLFYTKKFISRTDRLETISQALI
jgi:hypothetical protein